MAIRSSDQSNFLSDTKDKGLVVVKFGAKWCAPCKALMPILEKTSENYPQVDFLDIDVETSPMLAAQFAVRALPTLVFLKNGVVAHTHVGLAQPALLKKNIDDCLA